MSQDPETPRQVSERGEDDERVEDRLGVEPDERLAHVGGEDGEHEPVVAAPEGDPAEGYATGAADDAASDGAALDGAASDGAEPVGAEPVEARPEEQEQFGAYREFGEDGTVGSRSDYGGDEMVNSLSGEGVGEGASEGAADEEDEVGATSAEGASAGDDAAASDPYAVPILGASTPRGASSAEDDGDYVTEADRDYSAESDRDAAPVTAAEVEPADAYSAADLDEDRAVEGRTVEDPAAEGRAVEDEDFGESGALGETGAFGESEATDDAAPYAAEPIAEPAVVSDDSLAEPESALAPSAVQSGTVAGAGASVAPATAAESESAAASPTAVGDDEARYRERWHEIQAGFVDDPVSAATSADQFLKELADTLMARIDERRSAFSSTLSNGAAQTEDLRLAVRDFHALADRLIGVHPEEVYADALPGPQGTATQNGATPTSQGAVSSAGASAGVGEGAGANKEFGGSSQSSMTQFPDTRVGART